MQMERFKWKCIQVLLLQAFLQPALKIRHSKITTSVIRTTISTASSRGRRKTTTTSKGIAVKISPHFPSTSNTSTAAPTAPTAPTAPAVLSTGTTFSPSSIPRLPFVHLIYFIAISPSVSSASPSSLTSSTSTSVSTAAFAFAFAAVASIFALTKPLDQHSYGKSLVTRMGSCFGRCVSKEPLPSAAATCLWRHNNSTDEQEAELISNASSKSKKKNLIFRIIKFKKKQKHPQFLDKFWERQDMNYAKLTTKNSNDGLSDIQLQNLDVNSLFASSQDSKESATTAALGSHTAIASSRASSSLDLEWEHEYFRQSVLSQTNTELSQMMSAHNQQTNLTDSWQLLPTNDEDQLNSIGSQDQSLLQADVNTPELNITNGIRRFIGGPGTGTSGRVITNRNKNGSFTRTSSHTSWSHISTPESLEWDIDEEQQRQLHLEDDNLDHETLELLHQIEQLKNQVLNETGEGLYEREGIEFSTATQNVSAVVGAKHVEYGGYSGANIS